MSRSYKIKAFAHKYLPNWGHLKYYKNDLIRKENLVALQKKEKIRCAFFVVFHTVWKCDYIYKRMLADDRFDPVIVICPVVNYGKEDMKIRMKECETLFSSMGYDYVKTYNEETDTYIDIRETVNPDIIVYTNPYKGLIDDRYYINRFTDLLTIYIPYYMAEDIGSKFGYGLEMHNLVWRKYAETEYHKSLAKQFSRRKGKNVVVTGYPGTEVFLDKSYTPKDVWPISDKSVKRVIWAPHHTLEAVGHVNYSCFLQYADFMVEMAKKYAQSIQIVFKPHPILRNKLELLWGKEKTSAYYKLWTDMPNTDLNDGDYVDLFITSDAMIHDSGSFIAEYLHLNKPVMRTMNSADPKTMFNDFALECIDNHYKAYSESDIETFFENLLSNNDPLKKSRTEFLDNVLTPKGAMPSERIIEDIVDSIKNKRV